MTGLNLNKKLWRIPQQGMVRGVCAGLAHYLDVPVKLVRVVTVLSIFFGLAFITFVAYIVLSFVLDPMPDGELAASMRYLSQRYTMPYKEVTGTLTDIGTEELAHMEMVCAIVYQLTKDLSPEEIERSGFAPYYVDHTLALWPQAASGAPWTATYFQSKGDPITDLHEDLAAEQKARTTYDNILRLVKDPEVCDPIRFLRQREIVHYQRFGESLRIVQEKLDSKNFYAVNPEFDK